MFDSLKYAKQLEAAGVSREQAEVHIHIIAEIVEGELATKQDLEVLDHKIETKLIELEYRLVVKISAIVGALVTLSIAVTSALSKLL